MNSTDVSESSTFDVLVVGFGPDDLAALLSSLDSLRLKVIDTSTDFDSFLENYQLAPGTLALVSTHLPGLTHHEIGQALSSCFTGLSVVFITTDRQHFEVNALKKNGFTECLLLPLDQKTLEDILDEARTKKCGGFRKFKAVKLVDIEPEQSLPFEVRAFLPANKKYVTLTASGRLSEKKIALLRQSNANVVFVDTREIDKFYEFVAERLIANGTSSNDAVSQTEKSEKTRSTVRQLFRNILDASRGASDFETGRDLLDQSKKVIDHYLREKTGLDIGKRLKSLMGEADDSYSHAQIVSTVACLFSLATGIGKPEDLAIAGLFHDIGISGTHEDVSIFDLEKLSPDERARHLQHPKTSLNLLKEKKMTVSPAVAEIIEKHHERVDGKGFPAGYSAHRIPLEAHLLAYADAFADLTKRRNGETAKGPKETHEIIATKLGLSPELLRKVESFLSSMAS